MGTPPQDTAPAVAEAYDLTAAKGESGLCCSPKHLYSPDDLARMPRAVCDLSSGCGDPVSLAQIPKGATVLDIGSGAGLDCILAARLAGPTGRVIGVDPSPTMRRLATTYAKEFDLNSVEFLDGSAERLPVDDATIDILISNCVLCLSANPDAVWSEIGRVLRPGGRFTISDTVGEHAGESLDARVRCELGLSWLDYLRHFAVNRLSGIRLREADYVRFRDGKFVLSATVSGSRDAPHWVWLQIFARDGQRHLARSVATGLLRELADRPVSSGHEILALEEQRSQNIFNLVAGETDAADPGLDGDHRVWIAANGRLLGQASSQDSDTGHIVDQIISSTTKPGVGIR
jgi:SAM-dependent methyltransferase